MELKQSTLQPWPLEGTPWQSQVHNIADPSLGVPQYQWGLYEEM